MRTDLSFRLLGLSVSPLRALGLAHRFGFDSVETPVELVASLDDDAVDELRGRADALGLRWGPGHTSFELAADRSSFEARMHQLPRVARRVASLGCEAMTADLPAMHHLAERELVARLREMAVILGAFGIRLGLTHGIAAKANLAASFSAGTSWSVTRAVVGAVGYDNVGAVLDAWAWHAEGRAPRDLALLDPADIVAVQLADAPRGVERTRLGPQDVRLPGSVGRVPSTQWLGQLGRLGSPGPVRAMIAGPLAREAVTFEGLERFLARVARSLGPDAVFPSEREARWPLEPAHEYGARALG